MRFLSPEFAGLTTVLNRKIICPVRAAVIAFRQAQRSEDMASALLTSTPSVAEVEMPTQNPLMTIKTVLTSEAVNSNESDLYRGMFAKALDRTDTTERETKDMVARVVGMGHVQGWEGDEVTIVARYCQTLQQERLKASSTRCNGDMPPYLLIFGGPFENNVIGPNTLSCAYRGKTTFLRQLGFLVESAKFEDIFSSPFVNNGVEDGTEDFYSLVWGEAPVRVSGGGNLIRVLGLRSKLLPEVSIELWGHAPARSGPEHSAILQPTDFDIASLTYPILVHFSPRALVQIAA